MSCNLAFTYSIVSDCSTPTVTTFPYALPHLHLPSGNDHRVQQKRESLKRIGATGCALQRACVTRTVRVLKIITMEKYPKS